MNIYNIETFKEPIHWYIVNIGVCSIGICACLWILFLGITFFKPLDILFLVLVAGVLCYHAYLLVCSVLEFLRVMRNLSWNYEKRCSNCNHYHQVRYLNQGSESVLQLCRSLTSPPQDIFLQDETPCPKFELNIEKVKNNARLLNS